MYQLPHHHLHHQYTTHHQQQPPPQHPGAAVVHPFPPLYLFPNPSAAATEPPDVQGEGLITTPTATAAASTGGFDGRNTHTPPPAVATHKPQRHHEPEPAATKPSGSGGGRSRKSAASKNKAAASSHHGGRRKQTESSLRGMGVEQLEEHMRLQEAAAASRQKKLPLPKVKPSKKPVSRPVIQQEATATFPDEHYGSPVEYGVPVAAAVISAERQRQIQLLQQYQAWVRRVTGAVSGGQPTAVNVTSQYPAGAGRSSGSLFHHHQDAISAAAAGELSSIPKININNTPSYDDLPTCYAPCCLDQRKSFSTAAAMVQRSSGMVISRGGERFQEAANNNNEAPLMNPSSSSSSSNYQRLPAGLVMMNYVQNDAAVHFTRWDMEAISMAPDFCRSKPPSYPYRDTINLNQPTVDMAAAHNEDDAQRKWNSSSSSACGNTNGGIGNGMAGMEYYEFFPSDKTTSGEIVMKGGTSPKEEYSGDQEEEEEVEVEDYLMLEGSGPDVGYGGEASCLTTSDHHHHHEQQQYYSSSSGYNYPLASNSTPTNTTTTTTNSISSSLDLSLKLSF